MPSYSEKSPGAQQEGAIAKLKLWSSEILFDLTRSSALTDAANIAERYSQPLD